MALRLQFVTGFWLEGSLHGLTTPTTEQSFDIREDRLIGDRREPVEERVHTVLGVPEGACGCLCLETSWQTMSPRIRQISNKHASDPSPVNRPGHHL